MRACAGVVGLAIARELAQAGHKVVLLDKNDAVGQETSARNSEGALLRSQCRARAHCTLHVAGASSASIVSVRCSLLRGQRQPKINMTDGARFAVIHGGLYYATGTLKARMCVDGRRKLYEYARARGIPHRNCGKLIVAQNDAQVEKLEQLLEKAHANGVAECELISQDECLRREPAVRAVKGGLYCPVTGVIDSVALMAALREDAEAVRFQSLVATFCLLEGCHHRAG